VSVGAGGIAPVNVSARAGGDPGVAVVGIHQVQILDLILPVYVCAAEVAINPVLQSAGAVGIRVNDVVEQQGGQTVSRQPHTSVIQGIGSAALRLNRHGG